MRKFPLISAVALRLATPAAVSAERDGTQGMTSDPGPSLRLMTFASKPGRHGTTARRVVALAFATGAMTSEIAFAETPLPPATFSLSLNSSGYGRLLSAPGSSSYSGCNSLGGCATTMGSTSSTLKATIGGS
jgi:hypothetical protein